MMLHFLRAFSLFVCVCVILASQVDESTLLPLEDELATATVKHFAGT
jgi:hypothetical protein